MTSCELALAAGSGAHQFTPVGTPDAYGAYRWEPVKQSPSGAGSPYALCLPKLPVNRSSLARHFCRRGLLTLQRRGWSPTGAGGDGFWDTAGLRTDIPLQRYGARSR